VSGLFGVWVQARCCNPSNFGCSTDVRRQRHVCHNMQSVSAADTVARNGPSMPSVSTSSGSRLDVRELRSPDGTQFMIYTSHTSNRSLPNNRRGEQPYLRPTADQRTKPPLCQRRKASSVVVTIVEVCIRNACSLRCSSRVTLASSVCRSTRLCQHDHALLITRCVVRMTSHQPCKRQLVGREH
jgi:hypothetical protein